MHGVKEELHHEVLPVDVNPAPEISEARSQKVEMVCLWQVKTKHVQQTHNQVESSGDTQIQQVHSQHASSYIECRGQLVNVQRRKLVYYPIQ